MSVSRTDTNTWKPFSSTRTSLALESVRPFFLMPRVWPWAQRPQPSITNSHAKKRSPAPTAMRPAVAALIQTALPFRAERQM